MSKKPKKTKTFDASIFKEKNKSRIKEIPKTLKGIKPGTKAFLLSGPFAPEEKREGRVVEYSPVEDKIILEFEEETLHTSLNFYGQSWLLLKK